MIEDVILEHDKRGMNKLKEYLPSDFCKRAAYFLHGNMEKILIVTGFYVGGYCETDGPVSAIMLRKALTSLGSKVDIVTDRYCYEVLTRLKIPDVHCFPINGEKESLEFAENVISVIDPSIIVSVERCGRAKDGKYYNMRGEDISEYTGKVDFLFDFPKTIGIGDGGNEIGMGNLYEHVKSVVLHGEKIGSVVETTFLVISSVSNWGVYGVMAYLSEIEGKMLLKREDRILENVVQAGAIDSASRKAALMVDGFSLEVTNRIIEELKREVGYSLD